MTPARPMSSASRRERTIAVVFGTRPEAIKVAPVVRALAADGDIRPFVVVTGQHREMLDQVLEPFGIEPDADLGILRRGQTLSEIASRVLAGLEAVLGDASPEAVLVQGDTTTTMAGALAAFHARIPVAHLEAGLRTHDRSSPFPEEVNRRLTTTLADLHLAPTAQARSNLLNDGVKPDAIVVTGNTVIDSLLWAVDRRVPYHDPGLEALDHDDRRVVLVTTHRRESWGAPMRGVADALRRVVQTYPDVVVVVPLHLNPIVREALLPLLDGHPRVLLREPLPYGAFARLLQRADLVLTDSGGIQEEAPSLGKPVLVLRDTTERPEALAAGVAELVGTDPEAVFVATSSLLEDPRRYKAMATAVNPYGDGRATPRVLAALRRLLGLDAEEPPEFSPDVSGGMPK